MIRRLGLCVVIGLLAAGPVLAADDVSGTWKISFTIPDSGMKIQVSMKVKLEGDKLTGTYIGLDGTESPIKEGTFKDGQLSFSVDRERDGNKFTLKYKGKVEKEAIKGKISVDFGGESREFEFEGKKEK